jgi:hypothetical protein
VNDFVVYHNAKRMGYPASEVNALSIVTNKPASGAKGGRVWLITGGRPKEFWLRGIFTVDEVGRSDHPHFKIEVSGSAGELFEPMLRLDQEEWFDDFKYTQGNFAFGFQPIKDPAVVKGLLSVVERSRRASRARRPNVR